MSHALRVDGLETVQAALVRFPGRMQQAMAGAMEDVVSDLEAEVHERTPTTFGVLRNSLLSVVQASPAGVLGVVGSPLEYAPYVELGTKPHAVSRLGKEALAQWAVQKLGVSEKAAMGVAFCIARKIRREGTKGAFMFRDSLAAIEPQILAQFEAAAQGVLDGLAG